jgi:hypothetical protein
MMLAQKKEQRNSIIGKSSKDNKLCENTKIQMLWASDEEVKLRVH